eukprot:g3612.t1
MSNETDSSLRITMPNDENTTPALETPPSDTSVSFLRDCSLSPCHDKKRKRDKMTPKEEEEQSIHEMMQIFGLARVTTLSSSHRDGSNSKMENLWTRRKRMSLAESKGDIQALSVSVVNNNVESKMKQERPSNGRNRRRLNSSGSFRYV